MSAFTTWLDTFIDEKGLDLERVFVVEGKEWGTNHILLGCVIDAIKAAPAHEQASIKSMLVKIDFRNGNLYHYFEHLAKAIAL